MNPAVDLPWLADPLARALEHQRGHALLVHGAPGAGAFEFALAFAQARLCEASEAARLAAPCAACASCRAVAARLHPDLFVLLPEQLRQERGWLLAGDKPDSTDDEGATKAGKRKPSRQIRIDEVRALTDWITRTSSRGRGKMVLIHPAGALNLQATNALLKTLEEPPPGTGIVLTAADPEHLLATVRSRCQRIVLPRPPEPQALAWLSGQGVEAPGLLLAAVAGLPLDALAMHRAGVDGAAWQALPRALAAGQGGALAGWPVKQVVDCLLKVCHDAMAVSVGGSPRFFPSSSIPGAVGLQGLHEWSRRLLGLSRHDEHPWNEGLLVDALVLEAQRALAPASLGRAAPRPARSPTAGSLHSSP